MIKYLSLVAMLLVHVCCFAQNKAEFIRHYTIEQGLSNNLVKSINMDKNGYVWLATEFGMSRFDGIRFVNYTQNNFPQSFSNRFLNVYAGSNDTLYAVNDLWQIFQVTQSSELILREDLKAFENCIATDYGQLIEFKNHQPGAFEQRMLKYVGMYSSMFANEYILKDRTGYIVEDNRIRYLSDKQDTLISLKSQVYGRCFVDRERLYLFNNDGKPEAYSQGKQVRQNIILKGDLTALKPELQKSLEVSAYMTGTVLRYDDHLYQLSAVGDTIYTRMLMTVSDKSLFRLLDNKKQDMQFLASGKNGFYQIQQQKFNSYVPPGQHGPNATYALVDCNNRAVDDKWFLYKHLIETGSKPQLLNVFCASVVQSDSILWLYYENNILKFNVKQKKWNKSIPVKNQDIDFYVSDFDNGLYFFSGNSIFRLGEKDQIMKTLSLDMNATAVPQRIGIGCHFYSTNEWLLGDRINKLVLYNTKTRQVKLLPEFAHTAIRTIRYDKDIQAYWVSTYGKGLFIIDRQQHVIPFPKDNKGNLSAAHYTLSDGMGYYWVPTNNGLYRISQSSVKNFLAGHVKIPEYNYYSTQDGLLTNEFNGGYMHSGIRLTNGNLAFSSIEGVVEINPREFRHIKPYKIYIDRIEVDDSTLFNNTRHIEIKDNFATLLIAVSSPVFGNPQIIFEYNIPELSKHWLAMNDNHELQLSGLKPGNYTIRFRMQDEENASHYTTLTLSVQGPWYKSTPAIVMYGLLSGFFLFGIIIIRTNAQKKRAFKEFQIAESELKALRSQINPHHFSNALGSIQKYIYQNNMEMAGEYLANFSHLMRLSLDNSESDYITLTDEVEYLKSYIELENRSMTIPFTYNIDVREVYDTNAILVPSMLVQPFVENAIRHGLSSKDITDPTLNITFMYQDKVLKCLISDNGAGMQPSGKNKKISGFKIASNRLNLFGKLLNIPVSITQLPVLRGTSIVITMPYKHN